MTLGPDGINARIAEIQSRLDALSPRAAPEPQPGFRAQLDELGGNQPLDPTKGGLSGPIGGPSLQPLIEAAAEKAGVDPKLLSAVVHQESGGDPNARSRAGAQGLCQLMPKTARGLGVEDPFDPVQNLEGGATYLRQMLERNGGKVDRALASYNWGAGNVQGKGFPEWPRETQHYVTSILARMRNA